MDNKELTTGLRDMLVRGYVCSGDLKFINTVCLTVFFRHFSYCELCKDDLLQEGCLGVLKLVEDKNFNIKNSALNFVYTKIRNQMSNFMQKKNPISFSKIDFELDRVNFLKDNFEEVEIYRYVEVLINKYTIKSNIKVLLKHYFADKFGCLVDDQFEPSISFQDLSEYQFYVNKLEYDIIENFSESYFFNNSFRELIHYLKLDNSFFTVFEMFSTVEEFKIALRVLYLFSGFTVKFPSKNKLFKTDFQLLIYKLYKKGASVEELSKRFFKPEKSINNLIKKFKGMEEENE